MTTEIIFEPTSPEELQADRDRFELENAGVTVFCNTCLSPLTLEEHYYYETSCEDCERKWSERMSAWRKGGSDPELDKMYDAPNVKKDFH